jgi:hypothetical protein
MTANVAPELHLLRHVLAIVAYRGSKTVRDAPEDFGAFRVREKTRTPLEIVAHISDLFDWARSMAEGKEAWRDSVPQSWSAEVVRMYASIGRFDRLLAESSQVSCSLERLLQGPIADALTHVGQLAMLRHLHGSPIRGENYFKADIAVGRVGPAQAAPIREFD